MISSWSCLKQIKAETFTDAGDPNDLIRKIIQDQKIDILVMTDQQTQNLKKWGKVHNYFKQFFFYSIKKLSRVWQIWDNSHLLNKQMQVCTKYRLFSSCREEKTWQRLRKLQNAKIYMILFVIVIM